MPKSLFHSLKEKLRRVCYFSDCVMQLDDWQWRTGARGVALKHLHLVEGKPQASSTDGALRKSALLRTALWLVVGFRKGGPRGLRQAGALDTGSASPGSFESRSQESQGKCPTTLPTSPPSPVLEYSQEGC